MIYYNCQFLFVPLLILTYLHAWEYILHNIKMNQLNSFMDK